MKHRTENTEQRQINQKHSTKNEKDE